MTESPKKHTSTTWDTVRIGYYIVKMFKQSAVPEYLTAAPMEELLWRDLLGFSKMC